MASAKESNRAHLYSAASSRQYQTGTRFLEKLELRPGDKVLDMGCGTGELTKYIAEQVGDIGQVIGVDPDGPRIKFAKEHAKSVRNVGFHEGNSKSAFPYKGEAYYDLHFSNCVYHWLSDEEKAEYIHVAFQCLKPGGSIAIQCLAASGEDTIDSMNRSANVIVPKQAETRTLLHNCGFTDINIATISNTLYFNSFDEFSVFFFASTQRKIEELGDELWFEKFKMKSVQDDGKAQFELKILQSIARK